VLKAIILNVRVRKHFFLDQQFITWGMRAGCGSYFVATYKTSKLYKKGNKKEKEK